MELFFCHNAITVLEGLKEDGAPCGTCGKMVTNRDKGVWCEVCEKWYHSNCEDLSLQIVEKGNSRCALVL